MQGWQYEKTSLTNARFVFDWNWKQYYQSRTINSDTLLCDNAEYPKYSYNVLIQLSVEKDALFFWKKYFS